MRAIISGMDALTSQTLRFVQRYRLFCRGEAVVGLFGGPDSACLLHMLRGTKRCAQGRCELGNASPLPAAQRHPGSLTRDIAAHNAQVRRWIQKLRLPGPPRAWLPFGP